MAMSVKQEDPSVNRCCSFNSSPFAKGDHWDVHEGFIEGNLIDQLQSVVKSVVKIPTNLYSPSEQVVAEMDKYTFAGSVLQRCPDAAKCVKLVPTFLTARVGKHNALGQENDGDNHNLRDRAKVVVQEHKVGEIEWLLNIGNENQIPPVDLDSGASLLKLVHESYAFSRGQCVIAGMKGVKAHDDTDQMTYYVTSLTIHSREKKYCEKDQGVEGIQLYMNWLGLSTPPPELRDTNADLPRIPWRPKKSSFPKSPDHEAELRSLWGPPPPYPPLPSHSFIAPEPDSLPRTVDQESINKAISVCLSWKGNVYPSSSSAFMG
ncbi:uncharacterized protein [Littorina saxatilis]